MDYPPTQPDEGYSEDPLNPSIAFSFSGTRDVSGGLSGSRSSTDFQAWLSKHLSNLPVSVKTQLAMTVLDDLPTSVIAQIVQRLNPRLYIDFIQYLPPEVCLKILGFLDPVSLINVARSCRSWYDLALDRKLWERLYHLEGWRALYPEIQAWEQKVNEELNASATSLHRLRSSEDGHTSKKRAISDDGDMDMPDAERSHKAEDSITGGSIFGSPASSFIGRGSATPRGDMDLEGSGYSSKSRGSDSKGKGKGKASPLLRSGLIKEESLPPIIPANLPRGLAGSTLWGWDSRASRYRINWKYLYTMRRRLESNWERGKYSNFQLPHPDHPEEGHSECIYSLQFDPQYLVSGSRDRTIRIWSMGTRRLVRPPLEGHGGSVLCLQFDADPDEDIIVSGSSDSDVIIWRFSTGEIIQRLTKAHTESVLNVKFDKRILVTCSKDKSIKIFNRHPLRYGDTGYDDPSLVYSVPVNVRNYGFNGPADQLPVKPAFTMIGRLDGHGAAVNAVQICGHEVVSASGDRNIKVWDWARQICSRTVVGHGKGIACVQYDGRRIVSGSSDNEVKVFDRSTGLEVASLRAHTSLVRTVQAGFGDLPYSVLEDQAEAKKIDEQYFKALESGSIQPADSSRQKTRPRNAGSRRPEDITAFGAVLPPGGGGGKYARIVSGSYDQTIIIWRRDKEGVWKDVHHFRQEEAAEAAAAAHSRQAAAAAAASASAHPARPVSPSVLPLHPSFRPPLQRVPVPRTTIEHPIIATITPESATSFMALIDIIVPQGVSALQQALASYPTMLAYHSHIQAAIDREPSPFIRAQLRQVVSHALLRTQYTQNRTRLSALQNASMPFVPPALPPISALTGPNFSPNTSGGPSNAASAPGSSGTGAQPSSAGEATGSTSTARGTYPPVGLDAPVAGGNPRSSNRPWEPVPSSTSPSRTVHHVLNQPPPATAGSSRTASHSSDQPSTLQAPSRAANPASDSASSTARNNVSAGPTTGAAIAGASGHAPVSTDTIMTGTSTQLPQQLHEQSQTPSRPPPAPIQAPVAPVAQQPHHPHIVNADNNPARVFKLQFDARRIICCSQTSVIVGWDFCNGDPELEEVARFFGTVE